MRAKTEVTKEKLYQLYIEQNLTRKQVAMRLGCCAATVHRLLSEHGIAKVTGAEYAAKYAWVINPSDSVKRSQAQARHRRRGVNNLV